MNTGNKVTYPLDPAAAWTTDGETAWVRVKQGANGISLADEGDRAVGHLESGIAPDDLNGRSVACVYLNKAGATHFDIAAETLNDGDGFDGADDGKVKKQADLSLREGQVFSGGAAGSEISVRYGF